jgi:glycosyltransferase involved in cell wall biosynthesis
MLKVCALLPDYLDKPMGGLGVQFMEMYAHLKDKVDYYIIGYPEKPPVKHFKGNLTPFDNFEYPSINNIYHQLLYYHNALDYKVNFDIIHCFDWSTALAGVYLSRHFDKPLIYGMNLSSKNLNQVGTFFCSDMRSPDGYFLNHYMTCVENLGLKYANKITHVSKYYENLYSEYKDKSVLIQNGLNVKAWEPKRKVRFPGNNRVKVCYIGRACDMKGVDMIAGCKIPDNIDFYFVAAKKGAEAKVWRDITNKTNNINIFHIKGLFGQDKIDFLNAVDAVVMPSKHEPAGIVAMEALISKNVLITTAAGGIAETVEGVDYMECHSSEELQQCLETLANINEKDLDILKNSGYKKMIERDWSVSADQLYRLYQEILGEKSLPDTSRSLEQTIKDIEAHNNKEDSFFTN